MTARHRPDPTAQSPDSAPCSADTAPIRPVPGFSVPNRPFVEDRGAAVSGPRLRRTVGTPPPGMPAPSDTGGDMEPPSPSRRNVVSVFPTPGPKQPRQRLLDQGPQALRDAELVALVLRTGDGRRDAVALGQALLERHGGVMGLLRQDAHTLASTDGIGPAKAAAFVAARKLLRRAALEKIEPAPVRSGSQSVRRFLALHLARHQREVFGVILLSARNRLLAVEDLFHGSIDRTAVYPREVLKTCLRRNASAVVLFHNHPSGVCEPSPSDIQLTTRLQSILEEIDVRLLDHLVVAGMDQVSMAERGLLRRGPSPPLSQAVGSRAHHARRGPGHAGNLPPRQSLGLARPQRSAG